MSSNKQLKALEVPQVNVDFLEKDPKRDLRGDEKLTVLHYMQLDEAIQKLGRQKFNKTVTDNIFLEPVRKWVTENWEQDFVYDLSKKTVPISFRNSLTLALFTTKIADQLNQMGNVEIYADRNVQDIFKENKMTISEGLTKIDYKNLPLELKRELVIPIVDDLYKAESVARADLLFPEGIDRKTIMTADISLLFDLTHLDDIIHFDSVKNLDAQAKAARLCERDYIKIKTLDYAIKKIEEKEEKIPEKTREEIEKSIEKLKRENRIKFDKNKTFFDVFPYENGENKEDVKRAYKKVVDYFGSTFISQGSSWEQNSVYLNLEENGKLICSLGPSDDDVGSYRLRSCNALSGRFKSRLDDELRSEAVIKLVNVLKNEMRDNKKAIGMAKNTYSKTDFIVEKGLLEVIRGEKLEETEEEKTLKVLAKEAEETIGVFDKAEREEGLIVYSNKSATPRVLELDSQILKSIKYSYRLDPSMLFRTEREDNIRNWLGSSYSLLTKFRDIMTDAKNSFAILEINPTNEEKEVKDAYRKKVLRTHPDRTRNLKPEEILKATDDYMKATEAYGNIMFRIKKGEMDVLSPTFYLGNISKLFKRDNIYV